FGVHHNRAIPGDRLLDRLAGNQEEADAPFARLHGDLVAAVEQHQRTVAGLLSDYGLVDAVGLLGEYAERLRRGAEIAKTFEHIGEGVTLKLDRERLTLARRHPNVE